jgi:hypothetical protein
MTDLRLSYDTLSYEISVGHLCAGAEDVHVQQNSMATLGRLAARLPLLVRQAPVRAVQPMRQMSQNWQQYGITGAVRKINILFYACSSVFFFSLSLDTSVTVIVCLCLESHV